MMLAPFVGPMGSGVLSLAAPAGAVAGVMGAMAIGLLVVTALVIVVARVKGTA